MEPRTLITTRLVAGKIKIQFVDESLLDEGIAEVALIARFPTTPLVDTPVTLPAVDLENYKTFFG